VLGVINVVGEHERGVLFRRGRLVDASRGPGRVWTIPRMEQLVVVDMRPTTIDLPAVEVTTNDGAAMRAGGRVHAQVVAPADAVMRVVDYLKATSQLSEAALRAAFREQTRHEALYERGKIEEATATWGVNVSAVELEVEDA
jgi:regulator of protease activity HflC (stomatin/prohibitin superfamily)